MNRTADLSLADFRRLPGLYRRWELTEVCESNCNYQIEDAGTHADGTPLLAIYVSEPAPDVREAARCTSSIISSHGEAAGFREYISAPRHFDDGTGRCLA